MSAGAPPTVLQPQWSFPIFVAGWLAVCALLSRISGWSRLAEQFRTDAPVSGEQFRFASGSMGSRLFPANYKSCLSVAVSPAGLRLSLQFPFRFMSPPLFIPWTEVESVEEIRRFLLRGAAIRLRNQWPLISLYGRAGRCVSESYRALRQTR
jgi:hypothetical protein